MPYLPKIKYGFGQTLKLEPTVQQWTKYTLPDTVHYISDRNFYDYLIDNQVPQWTLLPDGDFIYGVPIGFLIFQVLQNEFYNKP
jgi:hypothetical protein